MSIWPIPTYTVEEYLDIDAASDVRNEFISGYIVAMAGNTPEHVAIVDNLTHQFRSTFRGRPCKSWSNMLRVRTTESTYVYPDIAVTCGEPVYLPSKPKTLTNPVVVIEVLSDSTQRIDRGEKFINYLLLESLQYYVLVSQDRPL